MEPSVRKHSVCAQMSGLVLVRHGESLGNVADARARSQGAETLEIDTRDPDTPLSARGKEQATALARHVLRDPTTVADIVLSSPYARATMTARIVSDAMGLEPILDERLRERDLGSFDGLTGLGIRQQHPEEAERRSRLGKFYYRPPGGESWTDVAVRVRQLLLDLAHLYPGQMVWVFTHQAVIMTFRLVLEGLDEKTLLDLDGTEPLANCSLTRYRRAHGGRLSLEVFADTGHLVDSPAEETHEDAAADHAADDAVTEERDR